MKKIISLLVLTLIVILPLEVKAINVDKNNLTLEKGKSETVNLSTTLEQEVTEISFTLVYTSNDVKATYHIASGLTDSTPNSSSHRIVLSEPTSGTISLGTAKITVENNPTDKSGIVNIYNAKAVTAEGETINLTTQSINVTIENKVENNDEETPNENNTETKPEENKQEEQPKTETPKKEENQKQEETNKKTENKKDEETKKTTHMLEKIESNIVEIELQDEVYEYTVKIKEDIEELDLNPVATDSKYKVEISSQLISELENNNIIITVKNGEEIQEYKINVKVIKVHEIEIDNSEFESTYTYKGKWIVIIIILSVTLFIGLLLTKKK